MDSEFLRILIIVIAPWITLLLVAYLIKWKRNKQLRDYEALLQAPAPPPRLAVPLQTIDSNIREDEDLYLKLLSKNLFGDYFQKEDANCYSFNSDHRLIRLEYINKSKPKTLNINIPVTQKFWLRLLNQLGENRTDEVIVQNASFDLNFRIDSNQPEVATRFLNYPEIMKEFSKLHPFNRFEIYKGSVVYTIHNPRENGFFYPEYTNTFAHPFCRGNLAMENEMIVTCKLCQTRHHQSCIAENKQCTTWGCSAKVQDFV